MSSKLIELQKSPSPALIKEILKLEAFKIINHHIALTVTEIQMTKKYLKNALKMLAVVSGVREVYLDHTNYARYNTHQNISK